MANRLPWFLSGDPDLLELLDRQMDATLTGIRAFAAWSHSGDDDDAQAVRDAEHAADEARRTLAQTLRKVLVPPLEPEDLYTMSERLDVVINRAKGAVRDAQSIGWTPDEPAAAIADALLAGVERISEAIDCVHGDGHRASDLADEAIHHIRGAEKAHRAAMAGLRSHDGGDPFDLIIRFEAYRSFLSVGEAIVHVAHRVWYSMLKSS